MCGFAGFINSEGSTLEKMASIAESMGDAIAHRGPDDSGVWVDSQAHVTFAHRRLSVLDLSKAGHQPMHSHTNRYVLAYNGEIYNHLQIRAELENHSSSKINWIGHSDTETIIQAIELIGVKDTLQRISGMFAIAVWDKKYNKLFLARDRFGEKPLYYGWVNQSFVFCSELKAIKKFPGFNNKVDREALEEYLQYCYVPAPKSIYEGIKKLLPGNLLEIQLHENRVNISQPYEYWNLGNLIKEAQSNLITDEVESTNIVENALEHSVSSQMLSDVPLGAFLSGGIDSSLIVSLMQKQSINPIKTFTIGFDDGVFNYIGDESPFAKSVANHLGTDHNELIVLSSDAQKVIPSLTEMYDEPFADSSQIPTHIVSKMAKEKVTVALSGDGGDELFGGYNRYTLAPKFWGTLSKVPFPVRRIFGRGINLIPLSQWIKLAELISIVPGVRNSSQYGEKFFKLGKRLKNIKSSEDLYLSMISQWDTNEILNEQEESFFRASIRPRELFRQTDPYIFQNDFASKMMYVDSLTYLPDDILCKIDRAAMSVSLETRIPFLDANVCKAAWQISPELKINKNPLKKILYKYIPRDLVDRPKEGFGIPVGKWLRGPLHDWAEELLDANRIKEEGYFSNDFIQKIWKEHLSKKIDWSHQLWTILMFQSWLNSNKSK